LASQEPATNEEPPFVFLILLQNRISTGAISLKIKNKIREKKPTTKKDQGGMGSQSVFQRRYIWLGKVRLGLVR